MYKRALAKLLMTVLATLGGSEVIALADPTRPSEYRAANLKSRLHLESILYGATRKVAVINGKALSEGESLGGLTVIAIGAETVRVRQGADTISLTLQRPTIRQEK